MVACDCTFRGSFLETPCTQATATSAQKASSPQLETTLPSAPKRQRYSFVMFDDKATVVISLALIAYFAWMDVALFYHVHHRSFVVVPRGTIDVTTPTTVTPPLISPFAGLSVKMMMMDPVNNYVFTPAAHIFNEVTQFSKHMYFVTPNMVSFIGLLFAIGAAKCMSTECRLFHLVAILLFQVRTWCDALDGIVARSRLGMVQHVSLRNTSGYVVDGVADSLGFAAFLIGCFQYLRTAIPKHKHYLPLSTAETFNGKECCKSGSCSPSSQHATASSSCSQRRVFTVVFCFGLQLALSAFFWDHYINAYHNLLEAPIATQAQADSQNEVLRSSITWVLMWFWRMSNAHTFIQMLLYAIYINKLWEFLTWIQFIGFAQIFTLAFFTEIHLSTVRSYILSVT